MYDAIKKAGAGYAVILVFSFTGFLIYFNVLNGPFIFDDDRVIATNYKIENISNFIKDFSGPRDIGYLSFAINYYFGGLNTFGYHLANIIIHIINAILIYFFIRITIDRLKPIAHSQSPVAYLGYLPFIAALIFLVHPIQTQAVSYLTQRFTSLAVLFYILALLLYARARIASTKVSAFILYFLSLFSAIFAMKTKEISFTLPFIILFYEFTFLNDSGLKTKSRLLYLLPFFLTLPIIPLTFMWPQIIDALATGQVMRTWQLNGDITSISSYSYLLTQFRVIIIYLRLVLFPANQTFDYDYPISNSIFDPATFISFIFLLSIVGFAIYLYSRSRKTGNSYGLLISFGMLWFFITLSVESSIIPISDVIVEHRIYLPSVGLILSMISTLLSMVGYLEARRRKPLHYYVLTAVLIAAATFSFSTHKRNVLWSDEYLMLLDNVNKSPNKAQVHNGLGHAYARQGRLNEAINEYVIASKLAPTFIDTRYHLGNAYFNLGRLDDAVAEYKAVLQLDPYNTSVHNNLGVAYHNLDRLNDAIAEYRVSLKLNPNDALTHNNLGFTYYTQGRMDDAVEEYKIAARLNPDDILTHSNLGDVYMLKGLKNEARKEFELILRLKPNDQHANMAIELLSR